MSTLTVVPDQPDDLVDVVAAEVRAQMARRRMTQVQLAELLGIKQVSVSERLRGKTPFRLNELGVIAEALGIHPATLLGGNSPSPDSPVTGRYMPVTATLSFGQDRFGVGLKSYQTGAPRRDAA